MTWHNADPIMTMLVETLPVPQPRKKDDLYLGLLESVVGQQLSTRVADVIFERFCALFPNNYPHAKDLICMETETLRAASLSNAKANYVRNIAHHHLATPITHIRLGHLSDTDILAELTTIKGVGAWTVQMLLMFAMDRPDVFPIGDLMIRQMMAQLYGLDAKTADGMRKMETIAARWIPHRTLACRYLWDARDAAKQAAAKGKQES